MYLGAVQPGQLTVEEIRAKYPVAIDAPPMIAKPAVEPGSIWVADAPTDEIIYQVPPNFRGEDSGGLVRTAEVVRDPYTGEYKHPMDIAPYAPGYTHQTSVTIPKAQAATWMWAAAGVGLLGLLWMIANAK